MSKQAARRPLKRHSTGATGALDGFSPEATGSAPPSVVLPTFIENWGANFDPNEVDADKGPILAKIIKTLYGSKRKSTKKERLEAARSKEYEPDTRKFVPIEQACEEEKQFFRKDEAVLPIHVL